MRRTTWTLRRGVRAGLVLAAAAALAGALPAAAGRRAADAPTGAGSDPAAAAGWLDGDGHPSLAWTDSTVQRVIGTTDDDKKLAAAFLTGRLRAAQGDPSGAEHAFEDALGRAGNGPFADDAAFAAIEAMEAAGDDAGAQKAWLKWEKSFPKSPLMPAARTAEAWNALRRGVVEEAGKRLDAAVVGAAWMQRNPRWMLARGTERYLAGKPSEALAALGPASSGPAAAYLRGLCLQATGARLQAAAAFQESAERWPASPLHDAALFGKANTFLAARDVRSAADEFTRAAARIQDPRLKAECELRAAGAVFLGGARDSALAMLTDLQTREGDSDVAARAQFLIGEALVALGRPAEAVTAFNRVLRDHFQSSVAASAQYRVARCLDTMGRPEDATGSYQAVVTGYALAPEAPAAGYLAGCGLLRQGKPLAAAPYFQLVLDRYAARQDERGMVVFARPEHQELTEAALAMLETCYHKAGDLGRLSGAPHLLLSKMPPSHSPWRAQALLMDADAMASQARYPEAQGTLEALVKEYPDHPVGAHALKLLAWTYARQGRDSLAIATEEQLLARWGATGDPSVVSAAFLDIAHERFNQKRYRAAAGAYEDFMRRFPGHPRRLLALYQSGLCYLRLDRAGDAVDRWETLVRDSASSPLAERAWARAGDVYFQAEKYADAQRCYKGLLEHFAGSTAASLASLRLAQCEYNAGHDAAALEGFAQTAAAYPGTPAAREALRGQERALYRLSQSPTGGEVLAKLIDQYPGSAFAADAQFQIARRAYQQEHWIDAADGFRKVVSRFPSFSAADQAQLLLAESYTRAKQPDEARAALEQFVAYFPSSALLPTVNFRLGVIHFEAQQPSEAAVAFERALADSAPPDVRAAAQYNLALCRRMLGDPDSARTALEAYRTEHPGDERAADVASQLGDLHETAGRMKEAAAEFEAALAAKPSAALALEAWFRLGRVREALADPTSALRAYTNAAASPLRTHPYRLSALARCAALHEARGERTAALTAYRAIMHDAKDPELVAAASGRVQQLEGGARGR
jgi:TolA-binding protein